MPEGGELILATEVVSLNEVFCQDHPYEIAPGEFLLLSVSDTGIGMDDETMEHIFEPFFTTKDIGAGTGLVLAAVDGTIGNHGGILEVHSKPGQGTTFGAYLSITTEES